MRKFIISAVSIILLLFSADVILGSILDRLYVRHVNDPIIYAQNGGRGEEIVFFGSSKCHCNYDPTVIQEITGLSCHNYGIEGQIVFMDYYLIETLLTNTVTLPKLVVIDLTYFDIIDFPTYNLEKIQPLYRMYDASEIAKNLVKECGKIEVALVRFSRLYRYNSDVKTLLLGAFRNYTLNDGFCPKIGIWDEEREVIETDKNPILLEKKAEYLTKITETCKQKNIPLLFSISPFYQVHKCPLNWIERIHKISNDEGVRICDMSQQEEFLQHPEWFWDPFHCNCEGAKKFSALFANYLRSEVL